MVSNAWPKTSRLRVCVIGLQGYNNFKCVLVCVCENCRAHLRSSVCLCVFECVREFWLVLVNMDFACWYLHGYTICVCVCARDMDHM